MLPWLCTPTPTPDPTALVIVGASIAAPASGSDVALITCAVLLAIGLLIALHSRPRGR